MRKPVQTISDVQDGDHELYAICRNAGCRHKQRVDIPRLLKSVPPETTLNPGPHERHFTDAMRCSACRWRGVYLWVEPTEQKRQIFQKSAPAKVPNYEIRDWGKEYPFSTSRTIATADNLFVGRGAYIAACGFYFDHRITYQQGTFVIADSKRDGFPEAMSHEDFKQLRDIESGNLSLEELEAVGRSLSAKAS